MHTYSLKLVTANLVIMVKFDQDKLFFIIAPDRSGTSLTQELMNTFPGFCNTKESRIAGPDSPSCWEYVAKYNNFSYLEKFIEENWKSEFFVEKSPPSINCLPQIAKKYPQANYVFLKRNPLKILLSQLNLFSGVSEIGTRVDDMGDVLLKKDGVILNRERLMSKRLLKMISNQVRYKPLFQNLVEIKFEDLTKSLDSQLSLFEEKFRIKVDRQKAQQQLKKPSYSSTFRYGLKGLSDKIAIDLIKLASKLWVYQ